MATSAPGNNSIRPKDKAPVAETLRLNGYSTAQFGKCREVPLWEVSPVGPFHQWPTGSGFEHFYGFVGGEASQYYPASTRAPPRWSHRRPGRGLHPDRDLADRAITWVRQQKALMPDKPFFMYFAPARRMRHTRCPRRGRTSTPGSSTMAGMPCGEDPRAPEEARRGARERGLTTRHDEIPSWDDMPDDLKPVLRKQMEIYAGFLEQADHEVGRVLDAIDDLGVLDDTLVFYIIGDNGASAEGTVSSCFNEMTTPTACPDQRPPSSCCQDRRLRHACSLQPLRSRLGACVVRALPVDQTGGVPLGRHPQQHNRALAKRNCGRGCCPQSVPPPSSTWCRQSRPPASRHRIRSTASPRRRWKVSACSPACRTPRRRRRIRCSTSR